jgi:syntaxin 16
MLAEEGNGIQMSTLGGGPPPAWVQDVDAIQQCLTEIQQRMEQLQSMHATRVGSVFGRDLDDMEGRIEKMTSNLTDQFRFAERLLQKVGQATRRAGGEEATVGANVQRRYVLLVLHYFIV